MLHNDQSAFDAIVRWVERDGGERAFDEVAGMCMYVDGSTGNKCAIGGILPDDELHVIEEEENGIGAVCRRHEEIDFFFKNVDKGMLEEMQGHHDDPNNWNSQGFWNYGVFKRTAADYGLTYNGKG
jgi:hypothetical protein